MISCRRQDQQRTGPTNTLPKGRVEIIVDQQRTGPPTSCRRKEWGSIGPVSLRICTQLRADGRGRVIFLSGVGTGKDTHALVNIPNKIYWAPLEGGGGRRRQHESRGSAICSEEEELPVEHERVIGITEYSQNALYTSMKISSGNPLLCIINMC